MRETWIEDWRIKERIEWGGGGGGSVRADNNSDKYCPRDTRTGVKRLRRADPRDARARARAEEREVIGRIKMHIGGTSGGPRWRNT